MERVFYQEPSATKKATDLKSRWLWEKAGEGYRTLDLSVGNAPLYR